MSRRRIADALFHGAALTSAAVLSVLLLAIFGVIVLKGARAMSWALLTQVPSGGFYLGGRGGIANAFVGSLYLGRGGDAAGLAPQRPDRALFTRICIKLVRRGDAFVAGHPLGGALHHLWRLRVCRWMILLGLKASLLAGIITVALFELPIMIRAIDEVVKMVPRELEEVSFPLGATRSKRRCASSSARRCRAS